MVSPSSPKLWGPGSKNLALWRARLSQYLCAINWPLDARPLPATPPKWGHTKCFMESHWWLEAISRQLNVAVDIETEYQFQFQFQSQSESQSLTTTHRLSYGLEWIWSGKAAKMQRYIRNEAESWNGNGSVSQIGWKIKCSFITTTDGKVYHKIWYIWRMTSYTIFTMLYFTEFVFVYFVLILSWQYEKQIF